MLLHLHLFIIIVANGCVARGHRPSSRFADKQLSCEVDNVSQPKITDEEVASNPTYVGMEKAFWPVLPPVLADRDDLAFVKGAPDGKEHDDTLTLDKYVWFSSHNSAFNGAQLWAKCSAEAISTCMKMGASVIELDVFAHWNKLTENNVTDKQQSEGLKWNEMTGPPVHHGPWSQTKAISFREACQTIYETYRSMIQMSCAKAEIDASCLPPPIIVTLDGDYSKFVNGDNDKALQFDRIMTRIVLDVFHYHAFDATVDVGMRLGNGAYPKFVIPKINGEQEQKLVELRASFDFRKNETEKHLYLPQEVKETYRLPLNKARGTIILRDKSSSMLQSLALIKNNKDLKKDYLKGEDALVIEEMKEQPNSHFQSISLNQQELYERLHEKFPDPNPTDEGLMIRAFPTLGIDNIDSSNVDLEFYLLFLDAGVQVPAFNMQRNGEVLWFFQWLFLIHSPVNSRFPSGAFPITWWLEHANTEPSTLSVTIEWDTTDESVDWVAVKYVDKSKRVPSELTVDKFRCTHVESAEKKIEMKVQEALETGVLFVLLKTKNSGVFHCVMPVYTLKTESKLKIPMLSEDGERWLDQALEPSLTAFYKSST